MTDSSGGHGGVEAGVRVSRAAGASAWLVAFWLRAADAARSQRDRGDVPGWVMIVVMTAALVAAILVPFREAIVDATQSALENVTGLGGQ